MDATDQLFVETPKSPCQQGAVHTWDKAPEEFTSADAAKANDYHSGSEVVIWTLGAASGNPISLRLLPDFSVIGDARDLETDDERAQAVEMARATLAPYIGATGQSGVLREAVLAVACRNCYQSAATIVRAEP